MKQQKKWYNNEKVTNIKILQKNNINSKGIDKVMDKLGGSEEES